MTMIRANGSQYLNLLKKFKVEVLDSDLPAPYCVYLVRCQDNALYCGITNDLEGRIKKHNLGVGAKSVKAHGRPVSLVWCTKYEHSRSSALKMEYYIKQQPKKWKEELVEEFNQVIDIVT